MIFLLEIYDVSKLQAQLWKRNYCIRFWQRTFSMQVDYNSWWQEWTNMLQPITNKTRISKMNEPVQHPWLVPSDLTQKQEKNSTEFVVRTLLCWRIISGTCYSSCHRNPQKTTPQEKHLSLSFSSMAIWTLRLFLCVFSPKLSFPKLSSPKLS